MFPDQLKCELDGVCSVCGERAHAGPTLAQFTETMFEMMDELGWDIIYLHAKIDRDDLQTLVAQAWERAKTQRV